MLILNVELLAGFFTMIILNASIENNYPHLKKLKKYSFNINHFMIFNKLILINGHNFTFVSGK